MADWWATITSTESEIFEFDNFFHAFPANLSCRHFVDGEIRDEAINFPKFQMNLWSELRKEEFQIENAKRSYYKSYTAHGVRWVGSEENKMELCYIGDCDWYFICKQKELFFSVSVIGSHPEVHCNDFIFCNSDGSSMYHLDLEDWADCNCSELLYDMLEIAEELIEYQKH